MIWKRSRDEAVSEIVGNLLILVITVALFSVVLTYVYSIPGPEATIQADIVPMLERTSAVDGTIHLQHTGGEALKEGETFILVSIDDTPQQFKISDGLGGKKVMEPGDTWSYSFVGTISTSAKIDVKIVDVTSNNLLFYTVVQRGVSAGGNHAPIIAYAWVDTTTGQDTLPNNDYTTWRVYAVCKDIDGDLPPSGSVSATITSSDNGDGTATVTAFVGGPTWLVDNRGDGVYMTGLLKVDTLINPGDYTFTVTATDDTARSAVATVRVRVSASQSSLYMKSTDEAPATLSAGDSNKVFLRLELLARGESMNLNQLRVSKLGTIPDDKVTVHCFWDKDRDGVLNMGTDYDMPGWGVFTGGLHVRDFIGAPLFTLIEDEPTYVWVVLSVAGGTEGYSVGVRVESENSVTCIGITTPVRIPPQGSFPMDSSVLTIKGVFKIYGSNDPPTRVLTNTNNVRMIMLRYIATGETVFIHKINLTLIGTIGRDQVTCYLWDSGGPLTGPLPFDLGTGRCLIDAPPLGWKVDKAWSSRDIYVYLNIQGVNGDTVGVRVDTEEDTFAKTELSGNDINPQAPSGEPIPLSPAIVTLASEGRVVLRLEQTTTMPTRAGGTSFQRRWLLYCYGEPIEFHRIKLTLQGTIAFDQVTGIRLLVHSAYPATPVYDSTIPFQPDRTATFETGIPGTPLFTVSMDFEFYGWIRLDTYIYLDHYTEGLTVWTGLAAATDMECEGGITTVPIIPVQYAAGHIPSWSYTRVVNGQLYAYGESLIPSPLVDSSQNVPVLKVTFNAEGQVVTVNTITIRKLGTVAMNLVTVRIYHDTMNDTVSTLDGNDIELDVTHAGNFILNAITFTPGFDVTPGTDYTVVVAYSLNLGTAGYTLGCNVNANEVGTTTALPNGESAFPNQCLNIIRNPPLGMPSRTVPILDRGVLEVNMEDLSHPAPHPSTPYVWVKLTFWAEGENVDVNRIKFTATNETGHDPLDFSKVRIGIFRDVNNNSAWDFGIDSTIGASQWFTAGGDANFFGFPLFQVRQRVAYNLCVYIISDAGNTGNLTINITSDIDLQSKGQVSGLSITPTASFPMATIEREFT